MERNLGQQATKIMVKLAAPFTKLHSGWKTVSGYRTAQDWKNGGQLGRKEGEKERRAQGQKAS